MLGFWIKEAQTDLIPYMLVVGPREAEADIGVMTVDEAIARLVKERDERVIRQVVESDFAIEEDGSSVGEEY